MNCVLYARVSTDKQVDKELSIPAQLQAMRDLAQKNGWTVLTEFVESGVSAKTAERPALQRLLRAVQEHANPIQVVVVHKIDRLARNVHDHATIKLLLQQHHVRLISVVENVDESVSGELVENIMASIAQFYSANLSEEVKKGMRQRVLKGGWPHRAARGYLHVRGDGKGERRLEVHPHDGPLIRAAFEMYATGHYSLKSLAAVLQRQGLSSSNGRPLAPAQVHRMLSNGFYAGQIRWGDVETTGAHEPLVSEALFDEVKNALRIRFREPKAKGLVNGFPLRGIAICASCRGHMTAAWYKQRFGYYHCSRRGYDKTLCRAKGYTNAKRVHAQTEAVCRGLTLSEGTATAIMNVAKKLIAKRRSELQRRSVSLRSRRARLSERELRLTESFVAGEVAPDAYKATASKLRTELGAIESDLAEGDKDTGRVIQGVAAILAQARTFWELHQQFNDEKRQRLLRTIFTNVVLDESGIIGFTLRPPFNVIFRNRDKMGSARTETIANTLAQHVGRPKSDAA